MENTVKNTGVKLAFKSQEKKPKKKTGRKPSSVPIRTKTIKRMYSLKGYTQAKLAKEAGYSREAISRAVSAGSMDIVMLGRVADVLDVCSIYLQGLDSPITLFEEEQFSGAISKDKNGQFIMCVPADFENNTKHEDDFIYVPSRKFELMLKGLGAEIKSAEDSILSVVKEYIQNSNDPVYIAMDHFHEKVESVDFVNLLIACNSLIRRVNDLLLDEFCSRLSEEQAEEFLKERYRRIDTLNGCEVNKFLLEYMKKDNQGE